jgi:hypothetical protein
VRQVSEGFAVEPLAQRASKKRVRYRYSVFFFPGWRLALWMNCSADNPEEIREVRSLDIASGALEAGPWLHPPQHNSGCPPRLVLLSRPLR